MKLLGRRLPSRERSLNDLVDGELEAVKSSALRAPSLSRNLGPSRLLVAILAMLLGVSAGLAWLLQDHTNTDSTLLALWQVQAAIAAVAPPLFLLVMEIARRGKPTALQLDDVLVRGSGLSPTAAFALFGVVLDGILVGHLSTRASYDIGLLALCLTIAFIFWTFLTAFGLLLDADTRQRAAEALIHVQVAESVRRAAHIRLARRRLGEFLVRFNAGVTPFAMEPGRYEILKIRPPENRVSYLSDVRLDRLAAALDAMPRVSPDATVLDTGQPQRTEMGAEKTRDNSIALSRTYGQMVGPESPLLIGFDREVFDVRSVATGRLSIRLAEAFQFQSEAQFESEHRGLRAQLQHLRGAILESIRKGTSPDVDDATDAYAAVLQAFLSELNRYASRFGDQLAEDDFVSFFHDWDEMRWLRDDLRGFILTAERLGNVEVLGSLAAFVYDLSTSAIRIPGANRPDASSFKSFVRYFPIIYRTVTPLDDRSRTILVDRMAQLMSELGTLHLAERLDKARAEGHMESLSQCFVALLAAFSSAMKAAYDSGHHGDLQTFGGALDGMVDGVRVHDDMNSRDWRDADLASEVGGKGQEKARDLVDLALGQTLVNLGLDAWLIGQYSEGKLDREQFGLWRSPLKVPTQLVELWKLHIEAVGLCDSRHDPFEWRWWESNVQPGRMSVSSFSFEAHLHGAWLLRTLEALSSLSKEQRAKVTIAPVRELQFWMKDDGELGILFNTWGKHAWKWMPFVGSNLDDLLLDLKAALLRATDEWQSAEDAEVISASISMTRVAELEQRLAEAWRTSALMRRLVGDANRCRPSREGESTESPLGLDQLDLKEAYVEIEGRSTMFFDWGSAYGRSMGSGEDATVVNAIVDGVPHTSVGEGDELSDVLRDLLSRIRRSGTPPVVVVAGSAGGLRAIHEVAGFEYRTGGMGQLGALFEAPVYHVRTNGPSVIVVADLANLGEWVQYPPPLTFAGNVVGEVLRVGVQQLGEAEAEALLEKQPELAMSRDGRDLSREEAVRELRKRVRLQVAEKFTYGVENREAGAVVEIPE